MANRNLQDLLADQKRRITALERRRSGKGGSSQGSPAGTILIWPNDTIPSGWLECDGSEVSRDEYSDLFAIIGIIYGSGDGSTTFNLPDLRGRVVVGYDVAQTEFNVIGKTGGEKTHKLTVAEMPSHVHDSGWGQRTFATGGPGGTGFAYKQNNQYDTGPAGGDAAHNNLQPYSTERYIIKTSGGIGSLNSTVESTLLNRVAEVEQKLPDYSLAEQQTSRKWIDGKNIYVKTVNLGALPNAAAKAVALGETWDTLVSMQGMATASSSTSLPLPFVSNAASLNNRISLHLSGAGDITVTTFIDRTNYVGRVVLEYTKP